QMKTMIHKGEIRDTADREVRCVLDWSVLNWCVLNIVPAVYIYVTRNCKKIVKSHLTGLPCWVGNWSTSFKRCPSGRSQAIRPIPENATRCSNKHWASTKLW